MNGANRLRLFDLTMIVIGLVIGMGIFRTSVDAASAASAPLVYFAAWIIGGFISICGAMTYAEIGARYPVTGAYYRVFSYAYHPAIAFAINISILVSNAASIGGVALIGAGYVLPVFTENSSPLMEQAVAISAILLFFFINLKGLRLSSNTQNVLMIIKICMLLVVIGALFLPDIHQADLKSLAVLPDETLTETISSLGVALVAVSFSYGGYQQTINFGSEVNAAQRNIPRAINRGMLVVIVLYLLTNLSYYFVLGYDNLQTSREVAATVIGKMFGNEGSVIFSLFLFLSVLAYVNVNLLSNPRVMYAMSTDGVFPRSFAKRNEHSGVYSISLAVYTLVSILVVFFAETFERILSFSIFLDCFGFVASGIALFILRKRTRELDGKVYNIRWYPLIPILFIAAYVFVGAAIAVNTPSIAGTGMVVLVVSGLAYFLIRNRAGQP